MHPFIFVSKTYYELKMDTLMNTCLLVGRGNIVRYVFYFLFFTKEYSYYFTISTIQEGGYKQTDEG